MVARILSCLAFAGLAGLVPAEEPTPEPASPWADSAGTAHAVLTRLCDDFGGRLAGSAANRGALEQLAGELRALGLEPELVPFTMPGWERGADRVEMVAPFARSLRVAALAYSQPHRAFEAEVVDLRTGVAPEIPEGDLAGRVGLLDPGTPLHAREIAALASARGLGAVLFTNRVDGGQLLARTGSFIGEPLPVPIYSIAQEEGRWIGRLLARSQPVRVRVETHSRCREIEAANLVVRLRGRSPERVIVGAHFDSWDLGQGAVDNGLGIAQLFAMVHAWRRRELARTIEFVWFNAEELGCWGSRHQAVELGETPVVAMVNLDMVGVPVSVNATGDDSLLPFLERWQAARPRPLSKGVENTAWFGSDHVPYQIAGVRAVTFGGPIDPESVRYYHDLADTIDKLPVHVVTDSTAIIADAVLALVNDGEISAWRRSPDETEKLFSRFSLEKRMQAIGYWPFR
jgi:Iap family predicted aminopeptidase